MHPAHFLHHWPFGPCGPAHTWLLGLDTLAQARDDCTRPHWFGWLLDTFDTLGLTSEFKDRRDALAVSVMHGLALSLGVPIDGLMAAIRDAQDVEGRQLASGLHPTQKSLPADLLIQSRCTYYCLRTSTTQNMQGLLRWPGTPGGISTHAWETLACDLFRQHFPYEVLHMLIVQGITESARAPR